MMPFRNLNAQSRRVIGYATLTYLFTVALLLLFAGSAMAATGPEQPAPPRVETETVTAATSWKGS